ncbi:MAG: VWA domain-containing protein [Candidatus Korobacteraceae bacterium]
MTDRDPNGLAASVVAFCRFVRSHGLHVGMQQTLAALEAADIVGIIDWQRFSFALRAALCSSHQEWDQFHQLFNAFWNSPQNQPDAEQATRRRIAKKPSTDSLLLISAEASDAPSSENEGKLVSGASSQQRLKQVDFSEASHADMAALEQLSLRLLRQMSVRLSRRLKIEAQADRVDLRRSIRRNISHGGDPIRLAYKGRKPQKKRLVIFLDVSGSMNLYSLFLLRFAYALQKHFKRVNTFLFSTSVVEVSDLLRASKLSEALGGLSHRAPEWSGGTRIGGSLREFNRRAGRKILSRNTIFIILSDGWDTGAPEMLAAELRGTRSRVQRLLWLNPLLGLKDYQPITRGMSAALPHVDVFAPAHNLQSLLALEHYL